MAPAQRREWHRGWDANEGRDGLHAGERRETAAVGGGGGGKSGERGLRAETGREQDGHGGGLFDAGAGCHGVQAGGAVEGADKQSVLRAGGLGV